MNLQYQEREVSIGINRKDLQIIVEAREGWPYAIKQALEAQILATRLLQELLDHTPLGERLSERSKRLENVLKGFEADA